MGSAIQTVSAAAVNTYFRAVLAEQVNRADFEPREMRNWQITRRLQRQNVLSTL